MADLYAVFCHVPVLFVIDKARSYSHARDLALSKAHSISKDNGIIDRMPFALSCERIKEEGIDNANT